MSKPVATITHIRGETFTFGLRSDPPYNGTETAVCNIKRAGNRFTVPPASAKVEATPTAVFVPATSGVRAHWLFTVSAEQSSALTADDYITDAKITYATGSVDKPLPLGIILLESVTE